MEKSLEFLQMQEQLLHLRLKFEALESSLNMVDGKRIYGHYATKLKEVDKNKDLVELRRLTRAIN